MIKKNKTNKQTKNLRISLNVLNSKKENANSAYISKNNSNSEKTSYPFDDFRV